ncbi:MAG: Ig-like domain-containing protein, partial [Myxococcota bacterium]|nr:Ig-like domain-containing protein [Myxococcota bacterium]
AAGEELGEVSQPFEIQVSVPDTRSPEVNENGIVPAGGALGVSPAALIEVGFSEALDPATLEAGGVALEAGAGSVPVAFDLELLGEGRLLRIVPQAPLGHDTSHVLRLGPPLADTAGNLLGAVDSQFTTGSIDTLRPANGDVVVESGTSERTLRVEVEASPPEMPTGVLRVTLGPATPLGSVLPFAADRVVPEYATLDDGQLVVGIEAFAPRASGQAQETARSLGLRSVEVRVLAEDGDEDSDGIPNGDEVDNGLDPERDDAGEDPDGDGLSNAQELARGTDPLDSDSDGDGLSDGAEVNTHGTNPLDADSDGDGIADGVDVFTGPRLTQFEPAHGASEVSVRPVVRAHFDEALDPSSVTPARFTLRVEGSQEALAAELEVAEDGLSIELHPAAALGFETAYVVELSPEILGLDGLAIEAPGGEADPAGFFATFTTGSFGFTSPVDGAVLLEGTTQRLAASGSPALAIATVEFQYQVGEAAVSVSIATDSEAPFETNFTVPEASEGSELVLTAVARDAAGDLVSSDTLNTEIVIGLHAEPRILGVPLCPEADVAQCETRDIVLTTRAPQDQDVAIAFAVADPTRVSVASTATFLAGTQELRVPVAGLSVGATSVRVETASDRLDVIVSVSEGDAWIPEALENGSTPELVIVARPVGVQLEAPGAVGRVVLAADPNTTATLGIGLLDALAGSSTPVEVTSSNPGVVEVVSAGTIAAGERRVEIALKGLVEGEAQLLVRGGGVTRWLEVTVGALPGSRTPPSWARPLGVLLDPVRGFARVVVTPGGATALIGIELPEAPAGGSTAIAVNNRNPGAVEVVSVVAAGEGRVAIEIRGLSEGEALLQLERGGVSRGIEVTVGALPESRTPPSWARPVGMLLEPTAAVGRVILGPSESVTVGVGLLEEPASERTEVSVTNSNGEAVAVQAPVWVEAGQRDAQITISTGTEAATAALWLRVGEVARLLEVTVGEAVGHDTPPSMARPVGVCASEPNAAQPPECPE